MNAIYCERCGFKKLSKNRKSSLHECKQCNETTVFKPQQEPDITETNSTPSKSSVEQPRSVTNRVPWYCSLQTRFIVILILLTTIITGGFIIWEYLSTSRKNNEQLKTLADITANRMSKYLVEPLWGLELGQMEEFLLAEMDETQIHSILVYDSDTQDVVIGKMRNETGEIISVNTPAFHKPIKSKYPIRRENKDVGGIEVSISSEHANSELHGTIMKMLLATGILYLTILTTIFFILRNLIIHPIQQVTAAADRFSLGELNVAINHSSRTEIGLLVDSINRMQASLKIAFKLLQQKRR